MQQRHLGTQGDPDSKRTCSRAQSRFSLTIARCQISLQRPEKGYTGCARVALVVKAHTSSGDAAALAATIFPLANSDPVPSYSSALQTVHAELRVLEGRQNHDRAANLSISRSARHPRVAVILGVPSKWHIPLLLCRSLSTVSALWWACQTLISIANVIYHPVHESESEYLKYDSSGHEVVSHWVFRRLAIAQISLSFLWVRPLLQY